MYVFIALASQIAPLLGLLGICHFLLNCVFYAIIVINGFDIACAIMNSGQQCYQRMDDGVFETIVRETEPRFQRLAYSLVGNWDVAYEVVQEAYMGAFDALHRGKFRDESTIGTWLYKIVHNKAIDVRGKQKRSRITLFSGDLSSLADGKEVDPHSMVESEEEQRYQSRRVHDALNKISDEQRIALQLFYFWGMPYKAIAKEVSKPIGTVKSRINSGKRELKKILAGCTQAA
ncbi:RNA polymerase sigma factor [Candidatus Woesearchaeota archaeon]|nr:RNA polymerase sigma factor [Candidatus Woesearchaeota archaeon]